MAQETAAPQTPPAAGQAPAGMPAYPPYPYGPPPTGAEGGQAPPFPYFYPPMGYAPPGWPYPAPQAPPAEPKVIPTQPAVMPALEGGEPLSQEQAQNLELIKSVPLEVTVEIGRTRRKVQDILSFSKGSLVVLDKLAGDQVDLFVNGKCIARGDVVVIDDNFGIRINEILDRPDPKEHP